MALRTFSFSTVIIVIIWIGCSPAGYDDYQKGQEFRSIGDRDTAILCFTRAIEKNPDLAEAYKSRAFLYELNWEFGKATDDCTEVVRLCPNSASAYFSRGLCNVRNREYEKALQDLSKAIELDPEMRDAYGARKLANEALGRHLAAKEDEKRFEELGGYQECDDTKE